MPPTPFHYAPNQVHNAQAFAPICRQRFPIDLRNLVANWKQSRHHQTSEADSFNQLIEGQNENWSMRLTKSLFPRRVYLELRELFRKLASFDQSEDCLNLNVYTPIEGKLLLLLQLEFLREEIYPGDVEKLPHQAETRIEQTGCKFAAVYAPLTYRRQ